MKKAVKFFPSLKHGFANKRYVSTSINIPPLSSFMPPFETRHPSEIKVGIGLSGGVDSAVSAYILREHGFNVTGIFMINWSEHINGNDKGVCYENELSDVRDLCSTNGLNIPLKLIRFDDNYFNRIFVDFISELSFGQTTPNPDALCSKLIAFGELHRFALTELECDYVATGHYAAIKWERTDGEYFPHLQQSKERRFDQSYFLSQIAYESLLDGRHLFPIGNFYKSKGEQIRAMPIGNERISEKASSTGLCYVESEEKFGVFLQRFIDWNCGKILDCFGRCIGRHRGLPFYTIGQRVKFDEDCFNKLGCDFYIRRSVKLYVLDKDSWRNELIVASLSHSALFNEIIVAKDWNFLMREPGAIGKRLSAQFRFRDKDALFGGVVQFDNEFRFGCIHLSDGAVRAATPGQIVACYDDNGVCIASAVIHSIKR